MAQASSLDSQTTLAKNLLIESLSFDSRGTPLSYSFGFTYSQSTQEFRTLSVKDHTFELVAGLGFHPGSWDFTLDFAGSNTPTQSLRNWGPSMSAEYTFGEHAKKQNDAPKAPAKGGFDDDFLADLASSAGNDEGYSPTVSLKMLLGFLAYSDKPNAALVKAFPALDGQEDKINQGRLGLEVSGSPWQWLSVRLGGMVYGYSHDVVEFQRFLETERSLNPAASALGSTLLGLPKSSSFLDFTFNISESWSIELDFQTALAAADGSRSRGSKLGFNHDFSEKFRGGLAFERDVADALAQSAMIVSLGFEL